MKINGSSITCYFTNGSDAVACKAVLTCIKSIPGEPPPLDVECLIEKTNSSLSFATKDLLACVENSSCLSYNISVYDVLPDGSTGENVEQIITNVTLVSSYSVPSHNTFTSSQPMLPMPTPTSTSLFATTTTTQSLTPLPSPSSPSMVPTKNSEGMISL